MGSRDKMTKIEGGFAGLEVLKQKAKKAEEARLKQERLLAIEDSLDVAKTEEQRLKGLSITETPNRDLGVTEDISEIEKQIAQPRQTRESKLEIVHSPALDESIEAKKQEIVSLLALGKMDQVYKDSERLRIFGENEKEIDRLVAEKRKTRGFEAPRPQVRREFKNNIPTPKLKPKTEIPVAEKVIPKSEKQQTTLDTLPEVDNDVNSEKNYADLQDRIKARRSSPEIKLPPRPQLLHKEDLGKSKPEEKEQKISTEKDEEIIQSIVEGKEIVDKKYFEDNKDRLTVEAFKRIGRQTETIPHEDDTEEAPEDKNAEPIDKDLRSPEVKVENPLSINETKTNKKEVPQEARDGNIDGLVEFNLGKLGINKTELVREMPEFFSLTSKQQNYVLEKLRQKAKHDVDELLNEERLKVKGASRLLWGFRSGGVRERIVEGMKEKGLESYRDSLKDITTFVETRGLDVEMTEKGMVLKFLSRDGQNDTHREIISDFNRAATALAEIPYDKTLDNRNPLQILQKKKYEKALASYEKARAKIFSYEGKNPDEINARALELSNIDDDIRMNQALTYNPEATSWVGKQIQKYGLAEKGVVAVAGFVARGTAKYAAGFGGGIAASFLLGGAMGRLRKGREFQKIASEKRYADRIEAKKGETGSVREKRAGVKEFIDSKGYADRINKLIEQIEKTTNSEKRDALIQSLNNRILVARERDEAGLVRFGKSKDELKNKFAFIQSMKDAQRIIIESDPKFLEESKNVAERLNNAFYKDEKKDVEKKEEMKKAFWRGARNGMIFFVGGFEANDLLFHNGEATKKGLEWLNNATKDIYGPILDVGEEMKNRAMEKLSVVSDENIIKAGKSVIAGVREGVADVQNEFNKAEFYANRGFAPESSDAVRSINPISERAPYIADPDNTFVRNPVNLPNMNLETLETGGPSVYAPEQTGQPVNFPNMPKPDSLPYDINNMPEVSSTPVAEAPVGARGAIGALRDLQRALINEYGDNIPEKYKHFTDVNADRLAIKLGMFRPDQVDESVVLPRGSSFVAMPDGRVLLRLADGQIVFNLGDEDVSFFDAGTRSNAEEIVNNQNVAQEVEGQNNTSPVFENNQTDLINEEVSSESSSDSESPGSFEEYKDMRVAEGYTHTETDGGDILSAEFRTDVSDAGPNMVEGYINVDGLKVDSKELKGVIDFLYDSKGNIKGMDLPKLQVEDVARFRANPEGFIGGSHDMAERVMLAKKLGTMNSQVEQFLKYRRIMEVQSLNPDSPEYKFLHEESNKLWSAIQKKVEYQFNPEYKDFKLNPIENTAPMVEVSKEQPIFPTEENMAPVNNEDAPRVRTLGEDEIATEADLKQEEDLIEAHRLEVEKGATFEIEGNTTYAKAVEKYGEVAKIEGKIITFEKGYVGFYVESMDEATAFKKGAELVRANSSMLGAQQEHIGTTQNGVTRIMYIFKKR